MGGAAPEMERRDEDQESRESIDNLREFLMILKRWDARARGEPDGPRIPSWVRKFDFEQDESSRSSRER